MRVFFLFLFKAGPPYNGIEYYIHRSGRTGRAGRPGVSLVLYENTPRDLPVVYDVSLFYLYLFLITVY